jgi:hypothetical protein
MNQSFAIIVLESLSIKKFSNWDDFRLAITTLETSEKRFVALKWSDDAKSYIQYKVAR